MGSSVRCDKSGINCGMPACLAHVNMGRELVHEDCLQWVVLLISIGTVVVNRSSSKAVRMKYASEVLG